MKGTHKILNLELTAIVLTGRVFNLNIPSVVAHWSGFIGLSKFYNLVKYQHVQKVITNYIYILLLESVTVLLRNTGYFFETFYYVLVK